MIRTISSKDPNYVGPFAWDFSDELTRVGDAIASITSVTVVEGGDGLTVLGTPAPAHANGVVTAWLSGGAVGTTYTVRARVTTTSSPVARVLDCSFKVKIAED